MHTLAWEYERVQAKGVTKKWKNEEKSKKVRKNRRKWVKTPIFGENFWILDLKIWKFFENFGTRSPKFGFGAKKPHSDFGPVLRCD